MILDNLQPTERIFTAAPLELPLKGKAYGLLAEGDIGKLTFQGTRYLDFKRTSNY